MMAADAVEATLPEFPRYKAAAINCDPKFADKAGNISRQLALVGEAAGKGAKLIAVPEMATTGYCWYNRAEVAPFVETIPGPTTDRFLGLAEKYHCWIVVGLPEVDAGSGAYYNSAALIGPDGVVGVHRKTHPYISEPKWAKQGDLGHKVFRTPIGNIGMLICAVIIRRIGIYGAYAAEKTTVTWRSPIWPANRRKGNGISGEAESFPPTPSNFPATKESCPAVGKARRFWKSIRRTRPEAPIRPMWSEEKTCYACGNPCGMTIS